MKKNICIIYPNKSSSSETFIQAHINNLPCNVFPLYGGWFPAYTGDDTLLTDYAEEKQKSILHKVKNRLGKETPPQSTSEKALLQFFRTHRIDAVLAEYGLTGVAVVDICKQAGIPLIVHFHGFDAYNQQVLNEYRDRYVELFQKASKIIAVSKHMQQYLQGLGAPPQKLILNSCGVDIHKFTIDNNKEEVPVFLFTGRFVNKKAPQLVIICFARVLQQVPAARLIMIGDGGAGSSQELYEGCRQMVRALGIEHAVELTGSLPNDAIAEYLKRSSVFIQHSVTTTSGDSEGTPVSLLEASAAGLAAIGTNHGGIPDVIIHGETGFIVPEYDLEKTTAYMIELAGNIPRAKAMGLKARERILEHYSMTKSIGVLWQTIENSLNPEN